MSIKKKTLPSKTKVSDIIKSLITPVRIRRKADQIAFVIGFVLALIGVGTAVYFNKFYDSETNLLGFFTKPQLESPNNLFLENGSFNRELILDDADDRVSELFKIQENMRHRVGFWFDIYTQYPSSTRVFHHREYPWIVYEALDTSPILDADSPNRLWMRIERANEKVRKRRLEISNQIREISENVDSRENLSPQQKEWYVSFDQLSQKLDKDIHSVIMEASTLVRAQTGQKDHFKQAIIRSQRYLEWMEEIFIQEGLPPELTRIPFVESSFNEKATSRVGASGVWQFMKGTGRKFMVINNFIDERRSPVKATIAATKLLEENHRILYGEWPLAITAWNHGPGGVRRASRAVNSHDIGVIVEGFRSRRFNFASSNFFAEFQAALFAEKYAEEIFGQLAVKPALDFQLVKLQTSFPIDQILTASSMDEEEFLIFNPDLRRALRRNSSLPKGFRLLLPPERVDEVAKIIAIQTIVPKRDKKSDLSSR